MAKDQKLSTLFKEIVWPLTWRSAVIGVTMGAGALAMIKYLREPKEELSSKNSAPSTPSP